MNAQQITSRKLAAIALCLVALGVFGGWLLLSFGSVKLAGVISKTVSIFVGSLWVTVMAFALRIGDVTDLPGLTPEQHVQLEMKARALIRMVWKRAGLNVVCAVLVLLPSVVADSQSGLVAATASQPGSIPPWMLYLAGAATGWAVFSVVSLTFWQEEFRRFKSEMKLKERKEAARKAGLSALSKPAEKPPFATAAPASYRKAPPWSAPIQKH